MARALSSEIEPYLEGGDQVENRTGLEFWFTPPDSEQKQVKRAWRTFASGAFNGSSRCRAAMLSGG
jgi:hypothetical protein